MSEDADQEERRFDPTEKRKRDFREKGRVAVSRDVAGAVQLVGVIIVFTVVGNALLSGLAGSLVWVIEQAASGAHAPDYGAVVAQHVDALLLPTLVLSGILLVATVVSYVVQTGGMFKLSQAAPQFNRINPFARLKELFSPKQFFVKSALTVAKLGLAALAVTLVLTSRMPEITALGLGTLESTTSVLGGTLGSLLTTTLVLLALVAAVDLIWQRRKLLGQMRMTKEEVKKELEEEEGRPEVKQRRRQRHRELMLNRIVEEVPRADLVLTNPTHVAVALRYRPGTDKSPIVVAKGADELAALIRKIARQNGVAIIEQRALARALFNTVKVGKPIPADFFQAVAQVLAKVFRARRSRTEAA